MEKFGNKTTGIKTVSLRDAWKTAKGRKILNQPLIYYCNVRNCQWNLWSYHRDEINEKIQYNIKILYLDCWRSVFNISNFLMFCCIICARNLNSYFLRLSFDICSIFKCFPYNLIKFEAVFEAYLKSMINLY